MNKEQELKEEIVRVAQAIAKLKADKKAEVSGYSNLIKIEEAKLKEYLYDLEELQGR